MVSVGIQHGDLKGATTEETSLPTPKFPKSTSFPMTFCRRKGENFSSSFSKPKPPGRSQQAERLVLVKVFGLQAFVMPFAIFIFTIFGDHEPWFTVCSARSFLQICTKMPLMRIVLDCGMPCVSLSWLFHKTASHER